MALSVAMIVVGVALMAAAVIGCLIPALPGPILVALDIHDILPMRR